MTDLERRELDLRVNLTAACQLIEHMVIAAEASAPPAPELLAGYRKCLETFRSAIDGPALAPHKMAMVVLAASAFVNSETDLAGLGDALTDLDKADPLWLEHMLDLVKIGRS